MTLPFGSSQRSTLGVEWELQLVDRDSHDLRQSADAIIDESSHVVPFVRGCAYTWHNLCCRW